MKYYQDNVSVALIRAEPPQESTQFI